MTDEGNIISQCPHCDNKLELPPDYLGDLIDCPECGEEYEVKAEPAETPAEEKSGDSDAQEERIQEKTVAMKPAPASVSAPKPAPEEKAKPRKPNRVKTGDMVRKYSDEVSSDSLMTDFKPKSILVIAIFTVIVHVVILGGTSFNFIKEKLFSNTDKLTEEQRKEKALADATLAIRDIAKKYELTSGDVTSQFSGTGSRADKVKDKSGDKKNPDKKPEKEPEKKPEKDPKDKSDLEKKLEKKEEGPEEFNFKDDF